MAKLHPSWRGNPLLTKFYLVYSFLLSSQPDHFVNFGKSITPEELAEDFHTSIREILQSSPQFGNYFVGPDVSNHSKSASFFERYSFGQFKLIGLIQLICVMH